MNHFKFTAITLCFSFSIFPQLIRAAPAAAKLIANTIRITAYDGFLTSNCEGSGVVISATAPNIPLNDQFHGSFVITNAHVICGNSSTGTGRIGVENKQGRKARASVCWFDIDLDIAILRADADLAAGLSLRPANPEIGSPVWTVGMPEGLDWSLSNGIVAAVRNDVVDPAVKVYGTKWRYRTKGTKPLSRKLLQITAPISSGSSGGPVYDDQGQLLALATLTLTKGQNLNFGILIDADMVHIIELAEQQQPTTEYFEWLNSFRWGTRLFRSKQSPFLFDLVQSRMNLWKLVFSDANSVSFEYTTLYTDLPPGTYKDRIDWITLFGVGDDLSAALLPIADDFFPNCHLALSGACDSRNTLPVHEQLKKQFIQRFPNNPRTLEFLIEDAESRHATNDETQAVVQKFLKRCLPKIPLSEQTELEKEIYDYHLGQVREIAKRLIPGLELQ